MLSSLIPNSKNAIDTVCSCPRKAAIKQLRLKLFAQGPKCGSVVVQGFEPFSYKHSFEPLLPLFVISPSSFWPQAQEIIGSSLKKDRISTTRERPFEAMYHKFDSI